MNRIMWGRENTISNATWGLCYEKKLCYCSLYGRSNDRFKTHLREARIRFTDPANSSLVAVLWELSHHDVDKVSFLERGNEFRSVQPQSTCRYWENGSTVTWHALTWSATKVFSCWEVCRFAALHKSLINLLIGHFINHNLQNILGWTNKF